MATLIESTIGNILIGAMIVMECLGCFFIMKITTIEV